MFQLPDLIQKELWGRVTTFLHRLKTRYLFLLFLVIGTSTYAFHNPDGAKRIVTSTYIYGAIAFSNITTNPNPPLRDAHKATLKRFTRHLHNQLAIFITSDQGESKSLNGWALGQIMVALQDPALYAASWPKEFFLRRMDQQTMAWEEIETSGCSKEIRSVHYPSTFWATYALHNSGHDITPQLQVVIDGQHKFGFWTTFAIAGKPEVNASTYSTVLATLLLHHTRANPFIDDTLRRDVEGAIRKAVIWLSNNHHKENRWLWFDYPRNEPEASISLAASAMVIHLLNILDPEFTRNVDVAGISNDFLGMLSDSTYTPWEKEVSGAMIFASDGRPVFKDSVRYYILPWMFMAVKDSYQYGSLINQKKAVSFLENHIDRFDYFTTSMSVAERPWIAAEFLIGLKYLGDIRFKKYPLESQTVHEPYDHS